MITLIAILGLGACATPARRAADSGALARQAERESQLAEIERWSLRGKIAVSDDHDGGSGRIHWRQDGDLYEIEISAPVSRRSWRLRGSASGATLEGLEGGPRFDPSAEALLTREVGWTIPFRDLAHWVRGARGEGAAELAFDPESRPRELLQAGWRVEFRAWSDGDPSLPSKVFASRADQRVRLVVERWDDGVELR